MQPDFNTVIADPEFHKLPFEERRKVLKTIDADFSALAPGEQEKAMSGIAKRFATGAINKPTESPAMDIPGELGASHQPPTPDPYLNLKKTASEFYRPMLQGGGAAAGAVIGTGTAGPLGGLAGGGLGYAIGEKTAGIADEMLGLKKPKPLTQQMVESGKDVATGAALEAGGAAIGTGLVGVYQGGKWLFNKAAGGLGKALTQKGAERAAGEILIANTSNGPIYARNAQEAADIERAIPGLKFSMGQRTNDPQLIKLERTQARRPGEGAQIFKEQQAANDAAIKRYYEQNFPNEQGIDDLIDSVKETQTRLTQAEQRAGKQVEDIQRGIKTETPQETGSKILDEIKGAKRPVQEVLDEMDAALPEYPMRLDNISAQLTLIKREPLTPAERAAIEDFEQNALPSITDNGQRVTTKTAMAINRHLNSEAIAAGKRGDLNTKRLLNRLKHEGLQPDLDAVSQLAAEGKIVDYRGKAIDPNNIAKQVEKNLVDLAEMRSKEMYDIKAMQDEIEKRINWRSMPAMRESEKDFAERLAKDYRRHFDKEPPRIKTLNNEDYVKLDQQTKELQQVLAEVAPGQDVAAAIRARNLFARKQYGERFKTGAVKEATREGDEITGKALSIEQIPQRLKTPSGADDLIRAVGPDRAKEVMQGNIAYDLLQYATNPDGKIVTNKLLAWQAKNKPILEKYGMQNEFKGLKEAQRMADAAAASSKAFEKSVAAKLLNADPEKAVAVALAGSNKRGAIEGLLKTIGNDPAGTKGLKQAFGDHVMRKIQTTAETVTGEPVVSVAQFKRLWAEYEPAIKRLYADEPGKMAALYNMRRAYEIANRNTRSPLGGGSDTAENVLTELGKTITLGNSKVAMAKRFWDFLKQQAKSGIDKTVTRGLFDPEYADVLVKGAQGRLDPDNLKTTVGNKIISLADYRKERLQQTLTGSIAASKTGE